MLSADSESVCMAAEQVKELIVIQRLLGGVYAIINLGSCLFGRDQSTMTRSMAAGTPVHSEVAFKGSVYCLKVKHAWRMHAFLRMAA